ncbi:uncharacterized protein G2W53_003737 [Senna tora]|uniref:Uncharacterized protein n=1 Tax=Senna tora TaxID=362788 RepID=A0A835CGN3_9FABA|nr:uncharacterized protein G2W53_003737 [Senna tora]
MKSIPLEHLPSSVMRKFEHLRYEHGCTSAATTKCWNQDSCYYSRENASVSLGYSDLSLGKKEFLSHFCKILASISFAYSELRLLATSD